MPPVALDPVALTRALVDIDSTTGREAAVGDWIADYLAARGYTVTRQPVAGGRFNVYARLEPDPVIVLSTHVDCVPPFFTSREENGRIYGRGACDAKGALAVQVTAAERLRAAGEARVGLLFVAGEERGSDGAIVANSQAPASVQYLVNGEPTDNRLGAATRGAMRVRLRAEGRAAHSAFPELGASAIERLVDALVALRDLRLPEDPLLGRTHYTVGMIEGGVAPNVVPAQASAEVLFRTVGEGARVRAALEALAPIVEVVPVAEVPAVRLETVPGFETAVFAYATDVPMLNRWGRPLLLGPGSIHVAHTDHEHVSIAELHEAVELYWTLARRLLGGVRYT